MKYKVYIVKNGHEKSEPEKFIEAEFNYGCGFVNTQEALHHINEEGDDFRIKTDTDNQLNYAIKLLNG